MDRGDTLRKLMCDALDDLRILAGDEAAPSGVSWQDVAGTASLNLRSLADALDSVRKGETHFRGVPWDGPVAFYSPEDRYDEDGSGIVRVDARVKPPVPAFE